MAEQKPGKHTAAARGWIEKKPGAQAVPLSPRKGSAPLAVMYLVCATLTGKQQAELGRPAKAKARAKR